MFKTLRILTSLTLVAFAFAPRGIANEKFALLVGLNTYQDSSLSKLHGENDVVAMSKFLTKPQIGFKKTQIVTLLSAQATKKNILQAFRKQLIDKAKAHRDGLFIFYFSGHGSQVYDSNGDEGDHYDETLVPFDSRTEGGYDITDDELAVLTKELCTYATNVVFFVDACNSGTIGRAVGVEKAAPIDKREQPKQPPLNSFSEVQDRKVQFNSSEDGFTSLDVGGKNPGGLMTQKLISLLETTTSSDTYSDLGEKLIAKVSAVRPEQRPTYEGAINRSVFGDPRLRIKPYFHAKLVEPQSITIDAGSLHGIMAGSIIACYSNTTFDLTGKKNLLACCKVKSVGPLSSSLTRPPGVNSANFRSGRYVVLNPGFSTKISVRLDSSTKGVKSGSEIANFLQGKSSFLLIKDDVAEPDYTIKYGTFKEFKTFFGGKSDLVHHDSVKGFFVLPAKGQPLFGAFYDGSVPTNIAEGIYDNIYKQNRITKLLSLKNDVYQSLANKTTLELVAKAGKVSQQSGTSIGSVNEGDSLAFKISNANETAIFVTLLSLNDDGSVDIEFSPANRDDKIQPDNSVTTEYFKPGQGKKSALAIITTKYVDLRFLKQSAAQVRNATEKLYNDALSQMLCDGIGHLRVKNKTDASQIVDAWATKPFGFTVLKKTEAQ